MEGLSTVEYLGSFGFWQAKATLDSYGFMALTTVHELCCLVDISINIMCIEIIGFIDRLHILKVSGLNVF